MNGMKCVSTDFDWMHLDEPFGIGDVGHVDIVNARRAPTFVERSGSRSSFASPTFFHAIFVVTAGEASRRWPQLWRLSAMKRPLLCGTFTRRSWGRNQLHSMTTYALSRDRSCRARMRAIDAFLLRCCGRVLYFCRAFHLGCVAVSAWFRRDGEETTRYAGPL